MGCSTASTGSAPISPESAPLALVWDDAHWGDEPSRRALEFLSRRLDELPVAIVVAARPSDDRLLDRIRAGAVEVLEPSPLGRDAVGETVRRRYPAADEAFCDACLQATGGNPFLVNELLRELTSAGIAPVAAEAERVSRLGSDRIARSALRRLEQLQPSASLLAQALCALGEAELAVAARVAGIERDRALEAAALLASAGVLADGGPLRFVHPIVRTAI